MTFKKIIPWFSVAIVVALFIISAYVSQRYENQIVRFVEGKTEGAILSLYFIFTITSEIIPPITSLPLLPIAVGAWGYIYTATLTIAGWTLGSIIAFLIARRYGQRIIEKIASPRALEKAHGYLMHESPHMFWFLVIIRILFPVDVLSYAVGLFTHINLRTYALATLLGITPGVIGLVYLGAQSLYWQIAGFTLGTFVLILGIILLKRRRTHDSDIIYKS